MIPGNCLRFLLLAAACSACAPLQPRTVVDAGQAQAQQAPRPAQPKTQDQKNVLRVAEVIARIERDYVTEVDLLAMVDLGIEAMWQQAGLRPVTSATTTTTTTEVKLAAARFADAYSAIKQQSPFIDTEKLVVTALKKMVSSLDSQSKYLSPQELEKLKIWERGSIGIEYRRNGDYLLVLDLFDAGPAKAAGISKGDRITHIDERPISEFENRTEAGGLRGKPGSRLVLAVTRDGNSRQVSIERQIVKYENVEARILRTGWVHLRIRSNLRTRTSIKMRTALHDIKSRQTLNGLVLDLRANTGGVLSASTQVTDAFIEQGLILETLGRTEDSNNRYEASAGDVTQGAPIVVLIDHITASGAEIIAAALQETKRAVIIGNSTAGYGSIQTIQETRYGGALKFTTSYIYTTSGRKLHEQGVTPDLCLYTAAAVFAPRRSGAEGTADCPVVELDTEDGDLALQTALQLLQDPERYRQLLSD